MAGLQRSIKAEQRQVIKKFFRILDTAGTPSLTVGSTDGTITDNGVGDYTVTFSEPFERLMSVSAITETLNTIISVETANTDATKVTVLITAADGSTPDDASCFVEVTGSLAADEV